MTGGDMEWRAASEVRVAGRRLVGHAALFNQPATIGAFRERIAPGAFRSSLTGKSDVLALLDHDPSKLLARTRSGTLRLSEDSTGLAFEIDVPDTQLGRDVLTMAQRSDLGGCSFGFSVAAGGDAWNSDRSERELRSVQLAEISIVHAWPAYDGTTVAARNRSALVREDLILSPAVARRRYLGTL